MKEKLYVKNEKGRYVEYVQPAQNDGNVYYKSGNKYVPFGLHDSVEWLSDGLWLARHSDGCRHLMNADYYASKWGLTKVGEIPVTDMTKLAAADEVYQKIDKYLFDKFGFSVGNTAHQDVANDLVKLIFEQK